MDVEAQLRAGLSSRAADIDTAPAGLLDDVLAGHHRSVRRRRTALVAGAVAVLVAVAVPVGLTAGRPDGGTGGAQAPAQLAFERYPYEPRGSLADDAAVVDGLLARDWWPSTVGPQPPVETRQVVFAGEVPGGVMTLVTGWLDGARVGQWRGGPAGAPEELAPIAEALPVPEGQAASYLWSVDGVGALVVVSAPGDVVEVSPGQDITAAGQVVPAPYAVVGGPDGTAVVDVAGLNPASYDVRVTRDGQPVQVGGGGMQSGGGADPDLGSALAEAVGDPDPDVVRLLVQDVLQRTGLSADQVVVGVRWGGPVGNRTQAADAAAVTIGLPSGATVLLVGVTYTQEGVGEFSSGGATCGQAVLPTGSAVDDRLVVARCDLSSLVDGAFLGSQLVVVPPAGTTQVQLTGAGGAVIDTRDLSGPAYVGPAPDGVQGAIALDGDGRVLTQAPLLGVTSLQID